MKTINGREERSKRNAYLKQGCCSGWRHYENYYDIAQVIIKNGLIVVALKQAA